jgi:hypothetical protein
MLKHKISNLYTYSGRIAFPTGAPTVQDMAISLCREGRYAGAGMRWYPVGLHTFVVCDMLNGPDKIHGWMHDTPECITGDLPKPIKTKELEQFEEFLLHRHYKALDIKFPNKRTRERVHEADHKALRGEVYTVGTQALQAEYPRCEEAEALTLKYIAKYPPLECIDAGGLAPIEFMRRFRVYSDINRRSR